MGGETWAAGGHFGELVHDSTMGKTSKEPATYFSFS